MDNTKLSKDSVDYYYYIARYNVRKYRLQKNMTSQELAELSGFTHQYIRNLESLKLIIRPRLDTFVSIAKALDIDFVRLFDDIEK